LLNDKQEIFEIIAPTATETEIKQWLKLTSLEIFLDVYNKNKNPKFENTALNAAILEIFKNRGDITDYSLDDDDGKYNIKKDT